MAKVWRGYLEQQSVPGDWFGTMPRYGDKSGKMKDEKKIY
jgi:hypothetical protein